MKYLNLFLSFCGKAWEVLKKIWTSTREMLTSEVQDLKERLATATPKNLIQHSARKLSHFFVTALTTAGLYKMGCSWVLQYVRLPFEDCVRNSTSGITVMPLRLGFRVLEKMFSTLLYDDTSPKYTDAIKLRWI